MVSSMFSVSFALRDFREFGHCHAGVWRVLFDVGGDNARKGCEIRLCCSDSERRLVGDKDVWSWFL